MLYVVADPYCDRIGVFSTLELAERFIEEVRRQGIANDGWNPWAEPVLLDPTVDSLWPRAVAS